MNNLMLHFSGADLSRLRGLVVAVDKEVERSRTALTPAQGKPPKTALEMTWSRLVEVLDLGPEPKMQTCPNCKEPCMLGATRCSHCWSRLPATQRAA